VARDIAKTEAYQQSRKDRKKVEILFAHLKRILKLGRLRLRGLSGARDEFLLASVDQSRAMAQWWPGRLSGQSSRPSGLGSSGSTEAL
jgi:hypothetical protein